MNFEEFFRDFWWLMFPVFGMFMAVFGMMQSERRSKSVLDMIRAYTDQGKEPPPELLKLAAQAMQDEYAGSPSGGMSQKNSNIWTVVVFAAMTAGFSVGWYMVRTQEWAFAFALVAVVMGIMALGALFILIFGRK